MVAQDPNVVEVTDMSQLPESAFSPREYRRGDLVTGEIVRIDDEGMVISAGLKTEGIVPPQEMRTLTDEKREQMQPGANVIVIHLNNRGPGGMAVFSYDQAQEKQVWEDLIELHKQDSELAAKVVQHNKGGLVVDWQGCAASFPSPRWRRCRKKAASNTWTPGSARTPASTSSNWTPSAKNWC